MLTRRIFLAGSNLLPWAAAGIELGSPSESADVLIVGGSLGGVAAALAACESGARVVMTEETSWIGGQATGHGVPLDEHPWIETHGRNRSYADFRQRVRAYYRRAYPLTPVACADEQFNPGAGWVSRCGFEPAVGLAVLGEMLAPCLSSGRLRIILNARPTKVDVEADRCRSVMFRIPERSFTLEAPYVLDATEQGDLLPLAGAEFVTGAESQKQTGEPGALEGAANPLRIQPITHLIAIDHRAGEDHRIPKPPGYSKEAFRNLIGIADSQASELSLRMRRLFAPETGRYESCIWNFRRVLCAKHFVEGAFTSDITMLMNGNEYHGGAIHGVPEDLAATRRNEARVLSLNLLYFLQHDIEPGYQGRPGFPGLRPHPHVFGTEDGLAPYPYIRESRRIQAEFTVLEQHFHTKERPDGPMPYRDSVGVSGYRIDIHERAGDGRSRTLAMHGQHWVQQIPLGALIPVRLANLIPACKNTGVTHVTNGAFRAHPAEWSIGEAAGALAAWCVQKQVSPRAVRNTPHLLQDFQQRLEARGVELAWKKPEIAKSYNSVYANVPGWHFGETWRAA